MCLANSAVYYIKIDAVFHVPLISSFLAAKGRIFLYLSYLLRLGSLRFMNAASLSIISSPWTWPPENIINNILSILSYPGLAEEISSK